MSVARRPGFRPHIAPRTTAPTGWPRPLQYSVEIQALEPKSPSTCNQLLYPQHLAHSDSVDGDGYQEITGTD